MNLQTLQAFLKLLNIFLEFLHISHKKSPKLQNIFHEFTDTPALPEVAKHFSEVVKAPEIVSSL